MELNFSRVNCGWRKEKDERLNQLNMTTGKIDIRHMGNWCVHTGRNYIESLFFWQKVLRY